MNFYSTVVTAYRPLSPSTSLATLADPRGRRLFVLFRIPCPRASSASPPLSPDVTRRPCKDTLTLRVYLLLRIYMPVKIYSVKDVLSRPSPRMFFCPISSSSDIIMQAILRRQIFATNYNSTLLHKQTPIFKEYIIVTSIPRIL